MTADELVAAAIAAGPVDRGDGPEIHENWLPPTVDRAEFASVAAEVGIRRVETRLSRSGEMRGGRAIVPDHVDVLYRIPADLLASE